MPSASYDYYPAPFPHDVPVVDLPKLSLESILQGDEDTAETLYQVCTNEGFYYIDLTTHPLGLKFLEEGSSCTMLDEIFLTIAWRPRSLSSMFPNTDI